GLAGAAGDEVGNPRGKVELGAASKAAVDHYRDAVERDRGLGDARREHDPATAFGVAADRGALGLRLDLPVEREDRGTGEPLDEPLAGALDLADTGEEREQVAVLGAPGREDRAGHGLVGALLGTSTEPFDAQRVGAALALDHRCSF